MQQLEQNIDRAKQYVSLGTSLERLVSNRDFKKVILEGFFEKEAIRLVHLKSHPDYQTAELQKAIEVQMDSIGTLSQYFTTVQSNAAIAAKTLEDDEATRDELLAEGV